ncbi:MAG: hypothetical protein E6I76_01035 [Chloroflexi bacterium]|nr:MAG: hypothetical protein E6I76_01035 [Chloroflexota bacterium]
MPDPPPATADPPGGVTAVGDSVMLGASSALRHAIPSIEVDAVVSRQWDAGVATVGADRDSGRLRPTLVVDLGTNGTVSAAQFDAMVRAAAGTRRIAVVTVRVPRPWEAEVNGVLRAGVSRSRDTVLVDWYAASAGHPEWFAPDGYHLELRSETHGGSRRADVTAAAPADIAAWRPGVIPEAERQPPSLVGRP